MTKSALLTDKKINANSTKKFSCVILKKFFENRQEKNFASFLMLMKSKLSVV